MHTHLSDGLDVAQGLALRVEAESIHHLLSDGHRSIQAIRHISVSADSVFVLTSIGVEKAMKVVMSLCHLRDAHAWPSPHTIREWGHDMITVNQRLEAALSSNVANAAHREYADALLAEHRLDPYWPLLIDVLDRFGRSAQFDVLDRLAETDPEWEPPIESWNRLEYAILTDRPGLVTSLLSPMEAEAGRKEISEYVANALLNWWTLIHRLCVEGCFGERGTNIGQQLTPFVDTEGLPHV